MYVLGNVHAYTDVCVYLSVDEPDDIVCLGEYVYKCLCSVCMYEFTKHVHTRFCVHIYLCMVSVYMLVYKLCVCIYIYKHTSIC